MRLKIYENDDAAVEGSLIASANICKLLQTSPDMESVVRAFNKEFVEAARSENETPEQMIQSLCVLLCFKELINTAPALGPMVADCIQRLKAQS